MSKQPELKSIVCFHLAVFSQGQGNKAGTHICSTGYTLAHAPHNPSDFFILQCLGCYEHPDIIILQIKES